MGPRGSLRSEEENLGAHREIWAREESGSGKKKKVWSQSGVCDQKSVSGPRSVWDLSRIQTGRSKDQG